MLTIQQTGTHVKSCGLWYGRVWFLAQKMCVKTGESLGWNVQKDNHGLPERRGLQRFSGPTNLLHQSWHGGRFWQKEPRLWEGGGRPQETKHEAGECKVYSVSSEWVEVVEQKVLEGEKSLVACNAGVLEKDLKVFNVTFLGQPVTCNVSKVP